MKGRTWCIEFLDDAKKDGDVSVTWKVIRQGQPSEIKGTWEGYKAGMTARQKAERLEARLRDDPGMSSQVGVHRAGNTVCIQLKDGAMFDDLAGVTIGDETGQTFRIYDDPDRVALKETVRLRLQGQPMTKDGVVRLGVGIIPSPVAVPTHSAQGPLAIGAILESVAKAFNAAFAKLGYQAKVEEDQVVIPEVPCDAGATAGTDDTGLAAHLTVEDPAEPMPAGIDRIAALREMVYALAASVADLGGKPPGSSSGEEPHAHGHQPPGGAPPHCTGVVFEIGKGNYLLACAGACPDGAECTIQRSEDHHGSVREWCGCSSVEPPGCHIVLYTPGRGVGGGPKEVFCAGSCDDPAKNCTLRRVRIPGPRFLPPMWLLYCEC